MCTVKTNIGHERINVFQHFHRKQSFLCALIYNYYKQESKIDNKIDIRRNVSQSLTCIAFYRQ